MEALFTAVDLSTLAASIGVVLVALIGVSLLFVAKRYIGKAIGAR